MNLSEQIEKLQNEIGDYKAELQKLESELKSLTQNTLQPAPESPSAIAEVVRLAAQQAHENAPRIRGLRDAIAELASRLQTQQANLADLQRQQLRQQRLARLQEGKELIRAKGRELEQAVQVVRSLLLDLKSLNQQYRADFNALYPTSSAYQILQIDGPVTFEQVLLPRLVELERKRFHLSNTPFNPHEAEKLRQREEEGKKFARLQAQAGEQARAFQQQREREQHQRECERLAVVLEEKRAERAHLEKERNIWAGSMDVGRLTGRIETLNSEIAQAQARIKELTAEAAV